MARPKKNVSKDDVLKAAEGFRPEPDIPQAVVNACADIDYASKVIDHILSGHDLASVLLLFQPQQAQLYEQIRIGVINACTSFIRQKSLELTIGDDE